MMKDHSMLRFAREVAKKNAWSIQKDEELLKDILDGLETNKKRYGFALCPCRDSWGDKDYDRDIICPCIYAKKDIEEFGRCYCALFCKDNASDYNQVYVKDRRPEELYP